MPQRRSPAKGVWQKSDKIVTKALEKKQPTKKVTGLNDAMLKQSATLLIPNQYHYHPATRKTGFIKKKTFFEMSFLESILPGDIQNANFIQNQGK